MSEELISIIAYLCQGKAVSKSKLFKLLYLADWKSSIDTGKQLSEITWRYDRYGPYSQDVINELSGIDSFYIFSYEYADMVEFTGKTSSINITKEIKESLDYILEVSKSMNNEEFLKLIYSTYPIRTQPQYENLTLVELAKEYKKQVK